MTTRNSDPRLQGAIWPSLALASVTLALMAASCFVRDVSLDTSPPTAGGSGGSAGSGATGGTATTSTAGGATTTSTAGGTGGTGGGAGAAGGQGGSGGGPGCGHGVCTPGGPLDPADCSCAGQVCGAHPMWGCCTDQWICDCVVDARIACSASCTPGLCDCLFATEPGYVSCADEPTQCTFLKATGKSCADVCGEHGTSAIDASLAADCAGQLGAPLDAVDTRLCVCAKACGAASICEPGHACSQGGNGCT